jgi:CheY-like chemotaxis protein
MRALIVEDDEDLRASVAELLGFGGIDALPVRTGRDALDCLQGGAALDLVLLDLDVPLIDGYGVLAAMRASRKLRQIPVLLSTGSPIEASAITGPPVVGVLVKPYDCDVLIEAVRRFAQAS